MSFPCCFAVGVTRQVSCGDEMGRLGVFEGLGFCHPSLLFPPFFPPSFPPSLSRLILPSECWLWLLGPAATQPAGPKICPPQDTPPG